MPIKSIAVIVEATPAGEARIAFAARLACAHGAHLIGLFVVPMLTGGHGAESFVRGHQALREVIAHQRAREADAVEAAKRSFCGACGREGVSFEFRSLEQGEFGDDLALNSLHADLVVAGGPSGNGGLPNARSAETLLLATGVPFLLLPESWIGSAVEHVVVGWNASREARRAVADALPLLVAAKSVTVLLVDPEKNSRHGAEPGADIALYLSRHGAKVTVEQVASNGVPVARAILDHVRQRAADLVIIGAYSHARAAQMVFGGVTRSLLREAAIPLLIAH